jgi:hypothetical protein
LSVHLRGWLAQCGAQRLSEPRKAETQVWLLVPANLQALWARQSAGRTVTKHDPMDRRIKQAKVVSFTITSAANAARNTSNLSTSAENVERRIHHMDRCEATNVGKKRKRKKDDLHQQWPSEEGSILIGLRTFPSSFPDNIVAFSLHSFSQNCHLRIHIEGTPLVHPHGGLAT